MSTLIRNKLEKFDENKRSTKDRRKKIAWAVFSYFDEITKEEYRKSFEAPAYTPENIFWNKIAPVTIKN